MRVDFFKAKSIIVPVIDRTILCKNLFAVILKVNILFFFIQNASVTLQILLFTSDLDLQKKKKIFFCQ